MKVRYKIVFLFVVLLLVIFSSPQNSHAITNGQDAVDLIGQYTDSDTLTPSFTKSGFNNGPNKTGFLSPLSVLVDSVYHRIFAADSGNHRVLVYNLDSSNNLLDYVPDYVIGQADFSSGVSTSTQSGFIGTLPGLALDSSTNRLFVSDSGNNRIGVFDVSTISNGMNAVNVLGQTTFTGTSSGNSTSTLNAPNGLAFDSSTNRLFVSDSGNNRAMIYDVSTSTITNGENASYVLGQTTFSGSSSGNSTSTLSAPNGLTFDSLTNRLFVSDSGNNRIEIFDVSTSTISNGENASYVLGQTTFTGASSGNSTSTLSAPNGLAFDVLSNRLFVAESSGNRVKVFDVSTSTITNGENSSYVLGQTTFSGSSSGNSTSTLLAPKGLGFDSSNNKLFVVESINNANGNRIKIFDVSTSTIVNGQNAVDLIGQYTDSDTLTPSFTKFGSNNGPNKQGLFAPSNVSFDLVYHRLFASDPGNRRVLVYNLDSSNNLLDYVPDYVIGQADFSSGVSTSTQSGFGSGVLTPAFDPSGNRLFVAEGAGANRVKVFDVSTITNGMSAINILGQTTFTGASSGNSTSTFNAPSGLAFDVLSNRLFVAESSANRVKVFDVSTSTISNGENASYVLGQTTFTGASSGNSTSTLFTPQGLAFDSSINRLFVAESNGNRVKVFDVSTSTISNGENASYVLGQTDFSGSSSGSSVSTLFGSQGLAFDSSTNRLFVAESVNGNRVKVFDVSTSTISNGEDASYVLGQTDFSGSSSGNTVSTLNSPIGLALNSSTNRLFVAESSGNRVKIFYVGEDPTQLGFSVQPSNTLKDDSITPSVKVNVLGASGNIVSTATNLVTLSIGTNPGSGTLGGTLSEEAVDGVATFSNLSINKAGTGYTLVAESSGLTSTTSSSFNITSSGSSSSGHHGSSGGSVSPSTTVPPTTPPNQPPPPDCLSGYNFSPSTGTRCGTTNTTFPTYSTTPTSHFAFITGLTQGSTGDNVKQLQIYLNTHGFPVSLSGVGSLNNESTYFGQLTKQALIKFQQAHQITPSIGYFGPITRAYINSH